VCVTDWCEFVVAGKKMSPVIIVALTAQHTQTVTLCTGTLCPKKRFSAACTYRLRCKVSFTAKQNGCGFNFSSTHPTKVAVTKFASCMNCIHHMYHTFLQWNTHCKQWHIQTLQALHFAYIVEAVSGLSF